MFLIQRGYQIECILYFYELELYIEHMHIVPPFDNFRTVKCSVYFEHLFYVVSLSLSLSTYSLVCVLLHLCGGGVGWFRSYCDIVLTLLFNM